METNYTSLLMAGSFLLLTLMVGLYGSHRSTTFREYAVGNKRFSTPTLLATLLATAYGGPMLTGYVPNVHNFPLKHMIYALMVPPVYLVISLITVRMGPFMKHLSLAETIGNVYGKYPRIITALFSVSYSISLIAIQIITLSSSINMFIDSIDHRIITVLATLILITYATFGGIRAVTHTDVLQFITFIIIISILAKFMFARTGKSILEMISFLPHQEKFQLNSLFHSETLFNWFNPCILCFLPMHNPAVMHRIYIASSPIQLKKVFLYAFFFSLLIQFAIVSIGIFVFVKDPALPRTEVWDYIIAHIPPAFKGCIAICLLGMTMSTADSALHICSVIVSHDMVESIRGTKAAPYSHQIRLAKLTSLVAGLLAMILAMGHNSILTLANYVYNYQFRLFYTTVTAPFILAVFGFRGTSRTALVGMTTGVIAMLVWNQWVQSSTETGGHIILGIVSNGLAMIAAHYLLPQPPGKGWTRLDDQQKRIQKLIQAFKEYKKTLDLE